MEPSTTPNGASFYKTCFNGLNALSGVGILSIPYALSLVGWLGLIGLFLVAVICCYTGLLLQRCMETDPLIRTYPDIGGMAFGRKGRIIVSIFMCLELYLVAVEFLILEGDNLSNLFPNMKFDYFGINLGGKNGFIMLTALIILPTTWLRNLGLLAYISAGGALASIVLVGSVFWVGAVDVGFEERGVLLNFEGLPTAVSMFTFCYCGHAVFPTLASSMRDGRQFSKVLLVCFITSSLTYGSMAVLGYRIYGDSLESEVTLNLPIHVLATKIAIYTTLVSPLTKYAVMTTPIVTAIEDLRPQCSLGLSILIRTLMVISTVIVAITIPFFGSVMSFIGSTLSILPCLCYIKIAKVRPRFSLLFVTISVILVVGSIITGVGTFVSVKQIVSSLK